MHTRIATLSDRIWPHFSSMVVHYFIKQRGPKQTNFTNEIIQRLGNINPEIKRRVLELYLARRSLQHHIRFLLWVLERRPKKYNADQVSLLD
jgi:hypothetical protein